MGYYNDSSIDTRTCGQAAEDAALDRRDGATQPAAYKLFENGRIGEWRGGMYRFYCYTSSWHISPAARGGYVLEGI